MVDAIKYERDSVSLSTTEPPIICRVALPEVVSVKYIAEISGQDLDSVVAVMSQLRIIISVNRSISFDDAARILRRYGIAADRAGYG